MSDLDLNDTGTVPSPEGGWSESTETLNNAIIVPPAVSDFVQEAGVLDADGGYCPRGALWRRHRPITVRPEMPGSIDETIPGRWLWGGVLWAHFGHFLVESVSRLWALNTLDRPVDGILFMPKRPRVGSETRGYQAAFVDLLSPGLPIRSLDRPVRVEELVVPGQGFALGPAVIGTPSFRKAMHDMFARHITPDGPEKLYISRSKLGLHKGGLLGEEKLETYLEPEGYEIFHPQDHDLPTQIARYKAARQVIAVDGSALHLFAMVGRPDQQVAMILRRKSGASDQLTENVATFCDRRPLVIDALRTEWLRADNTRAKRLSFGELDHAATGDALRAEGFVAEGVDWQPLTEEERRESLSSKGIDTDAFVESPKFIRQRRRATRQARRARRAAAQSSN